MSINIDTKDGINRVQIDGELTIYVTGEYLETLKQTYLTDKSVTFDLADVDEIDTSGLQLLATMVRQAHATGAQIHFTAMSDVVEEAVTQCRLMNALDCEPQETA